MNDLQDLIIKTMNDDGIGSSPLEKKDSKPSLAIADNL
jgi:hypothetical protein